MIQLKIPIYVYFIYITHSSNNYFFEKILPMEVWHGDYLCDVIFIDFILEAIYCFFISRKSHMFPGKEYFSIKYYNLIQNWNSIEDELEWK